MKYLSVCSFVTKFSGYPHFKGPMEPGKMPHFVPLEQKTLFPHYITTQLCKQCRPYSSNYSNLYTKQPAEFMFVVSKLAYHSLNIRQRGIRACKQGCTNFILTFILLYLPPNLTNPSGILQKWRLKKA